MRVESQGARRFGARWSGTAAIVVMLVVAVALPAWLYQRRGRKLPLRVVLEAQRYLVAAGQEVELQGRIVPATAEVELHWQGSPGVVLSSREGAARAGGGLWRRRWRAPAQAGVYELAFVARRSATRAEDRISIEVIPKPAGSYPIVRPPSTRPPRAAVLPECPGRDDSTLRLHRNAGPNDALCAGEWVVAELSGGPASAEVLLGRGPRDYRRGRIGRFRVPTKQALFALEARYSAKNTACVQRRTLRLAVGDCRAAGPTDPLFADFLAQQSGPSVFRLAAKLPRGESAAAVSYHWQVDDEGPRVVHEPHLLVRTRHRRPYHLVRLELRQGGLGVKTIGYLFDRSAGIESAGRGAGREAAGRDVAGGDAAGGDAAGRTSR